MDDGAPRLPSQAFARDLAILRTKSFLTVRAAHEAFLDLIVAATDSEIGYFHLYNAETQELTLNIWSRKVLSQCSTCHDSHYPLNSAGIWADCIRKGTPAIHNDYSSCKSDFGLPDGHFPLQRHMSLPVWEGPEIVATVQGEESLGSHPQLLQWSPYLNTGRDSRPAGARREPPEAQK